MTGYERVDEGETYFSYSGTDRIQSLTEINNTICQNLYECGNCYSESAIAINNARADRLMRRLRQWQALNDEPISREIWQNNETPKFFIAYESYKDDDELVERLFADITWCTKVSNVVYFATREKANEAIKIFRNELNWYFTEYQQRLDEE